MNNNGPSILYDWDILGPSIYIVDILRIEDLRIDDQSSILRSSIYRVLQLTIRVHPSKGSDNTNMLCR